MGPGIRNPAHRLQDRPSRDRFTARATIRDVFFGKVPPDPLPLVVTQAQHDKTYREGV